ncbi:MAG TPA: hypothetical protein VMT00_12305 [Thermoanaerobaculia bacterium]|nr:hypothetical protein [Thermoanaerobaculia bacterium]
MRISAGRVVSGNIVVEGEPLPEGAAVTILTRDADEPFVVDAELEAELLESLAEADKGETIPAEQVLAFLRNQG